MDDRIKRLAHTLVYYSIEARPNQVVLIRGGHAAEPLVLALYEELLKVGAWPVVRTIPSRCSELLFEHGQAHHFDQVHPYDLAGVQTVDASIYICASTNTRALSSVDPDKQGRLNQSSRKIKEKLLAGNWSITLFPTAAYAQDAEMSLSEFENYVYAATFSDQEDPVQAWRDLAAYQDRLIDSLQGADRVRIVGRDTDLSFSIKGRTFLNSAGTHNLPSGEIFTGPIEDSANGFIRYDFPVCNNGREIEDIRLEFKDGVVVKASAAKNEDYLLKMLDLDPGARRLGELGIGTNMQIQRFIKNILFDEKIGGTVHLALGSSYPATGGCNNSSLHWDMIKDLRQEGELRIDGQPIQMDV